MLQQTPIVNNISIDLLIPNPYQPRKTFNEETINGLALSIKEYGVLNPILVRKVNDKYEIIAGERRVRAAKKIGLSQIPAIIKNLDDKQVASIALIENLQRENLNPIEEAKSYQEILALTKMTEKELGTKLGKSQGAIANKIRLLTLPNNIQAAVIQKKISEKHARSLMKVSSPEKQTEYLNETINNKLTVKELDNLINQKEVTEAEIESAIKDIMKTLNIDEFETSEQKKEEKESDNMNNGNFFPNFNNQMDNPTPVSLNSMNMQSMQGMTNSSVAPMPEANEMVMPSPSPIMQENPVNMNSMVNPQPAINTQPFPGQPMNINSNAVPQEQPIFTTPIMSEPQPEMPLPPMPEQPSIESTPQINQEPAPIISEPTPVMQDTPLFTPSFENQNVSSTDNITPSFTPPVYNTTDDSSYQVPVNSSPELTPVIPVEEDKLTTLKTFLDQNNISYKMYSNETNHCIIIEI